MQQLRAPATWAATQLALPRAPLPNPPVHAEEAVVPDLPIKSSEQGNELREVEPKALVAKFVPSSAWTRGYKLHSSRIKNETSVAK